MGAAVIEADIVEIELVAVVLDGSEEVDDAGDGAVTRLGDV